MIRERLNLETLEHKRAPLAHHIAGRTYTRTGYGKRVPTATMVKLPGSNRWRRVYCAIFSNIGTCYVPHPDGSWTVILGWVA